MLDDAPAPASTTSECLPLAASFLTVSGVAATRVSPEPGFARNTDDHGDAPLAADLVLAPRYLATKDGGELRTYTEARRHDAFA